MVVLLSWNVHCVPVAGGCPTSHIKRVADYAARLAAEHGVSVFVLNEIFVESMRTAILGALRETGHVWNASPIANSNHVYPLAGSGVVVAWRSDGHNAVRKQGHMHEMTYKNCCQFDCLAHKGGLHVPFATSAGHSFHVVATHMQALELPLICSGVRAKQTSALGGMVNKLEAAGTIPLSEPVVFAGDFNEASSKSFEARLGATWVQCAAGDCRTHTSGGEFDHFYARQRSPKACTVQPFRMVRVNGMSNPSDHVPIRTKLAFPAISPRTP